MSSGEAEIPDVLCLPVQTNDGLPLAGPADSRAFQNLGYEIEEDTKDDDPVHYRVQDLESPAETNAKITPSSPVNHKSNTCAPTPIDDCEVTVWDVILLLLSGFLCLFDVGSDIWLAVQHGIKGDENWMILTITFIFFPTLIKGFTLSIEKEKSYRSCLEILSCTPAGYIYLIYKDVKSAWAARNDENPGDFYRRSTREMSFKTFEAYFESAPELILQLYIILDSNLAKLNWLKIVSVLSSLVSLSWALTSSYKTNYMAKHELKIPHPPLILCFFWHLCTVWARVLAISIGSIYLKLFALYLYIFCFLRVMILRMINICCRDFEYDSNLMVQWYMAYISSYTSGRGHDSRLQHVVYHTAIYLENIGALFLWYFSSASDGFPEWFRYLAAVSIIGLYPLGVFFQIIYYGEVHPKNYEIIEHFRLRPGYKTIMKWTEEIKRRKETTTGGETQEELQKQRKKVQNQQKNINRVKVSIRRITERNERRKVLKVKEKIFLEIERFINAISEWEKELGIVQQESESESESEYLLLSQYSYYIN